MTEEQDKQTAIALVEREWQTLDTWLRSLDERQLDALVFGEGPGWRVRDMVTHLASLQELAGRVAEKVAKMGVQPTTNWREFLGIEQTTDELNAATFATWRERPMAERWDRWLQAGYGANVMSAGWVGNLGSALVGTPSQRDDEPVFKGLTANIRDVVARRS